jgi:hypothetical protein
MNWSIFEQGPRGLNVVFPHGHLALSPGVTFFSALLGAFMPAAYGNDSQR